MKQVKECTCGHTIADLHSLEFAIIVMVWFVGGMILARVQHNSDERGQMKNAGLWDSSNRKNIRFKWEPDFAQSK